MSGINLVMPMAGRGSRFASVGICEPKPLIDLGGKPFFWWAVESVRRVAQVGAMVFVVLEEHIAQWALDERIREFYPDAEIIALRDVTSGSAETAVRGCASLNESKPLVINDCDHAFVAGSLNEAVFPWKHSVAGILMTFLSDSPNYSFVKLDPNGFVAGTVEKQVASPFAIAGCYVFRTPALFRAQYDAYAKNCPYPELYISGIYNQLLQEKFNVEKIILEDHFAFGTPEEYANVQSRLLNRLGIWR